MDTHAGQIVLLGLNYGEYHFHNNSSTPSFSYPSYTPPAPTITVKSFLVSKVFGYDKIVIADSSDYYIVTTGYGCYSSTFYEGQTIYIDTYSSPSYFDDIYTSTNASSKMLNHKLRQSKPKTILC